jgi:WhiB family transcriptional regulator, redox-sensing transcriptional regulator
VVEMDWTDQARCRGVDPEQFFVRGATASRAAIKVCTRCPVKDECLRYAIEQGIDFGVWGGLTERQRRAYQRKVLAAAS